MKNLLFICIAALLTSCATSVNVAKRKHRGGWHVSVSKNKGEVVSKSSNNTVIVPQTDKKTDTIQEVVLADSIKKEIPIVSEQIESLDESKSEEKTVAGIGESDSSAIKNKTKKVDEPSSLDEKDDSKSALIWIALLIALLLFYVSIMAGIIALLIALLMICLAFIKSPGWKLMLLIVFVVIGSLLYTAWQNLSLL